MGFAAGQPVRVRTNGTVGKVFLKLPQGEVYLVQLPGFPVVEKLYYASELELMRERQLVAPQREWWDTHSAE